MRVILMSSDSFDSYEDFKYSMVSLDILDRSELIVAESDKSYPYASHLADELKLEFTTVEDLDLDDVGNFNALVVIKGKDPIDESLINEVRRMRRKIITIEI